MASFSFWFELQNILFSWTLKGHTTVFHTGVLCWMLFSQAVILNKKKLWKTASAFIKNSLRVRHSLCLSAWWHYLAFQQEWAINHPTDTLSLTWKLFSWRNHGLVLNDFPPSGLVFFSAHSSVSVSITVEQWVEWYTVRASVSSSVAWWCRPRAIDQAD